MFLVKLMAIVLEVYIKHGLSTEYYPKKVTEESQRTVSTVRKMKEEYPSCQMMTL